MEDYIVNTNAPQTQRVYDWQKDNFGSNEWYIDGEYCGNCHVNLGWSWGLMHFCPKCGFMINGTLNPDPPEEDK